MLFECLRGNEAMAHTGTNGQGLVDFEVSIKVKNDLLVKLKQNILYFIGDQHEMLCPCGCGQIIRIYTCSSHLKSSCGNLVTITPIIHVPSCGTYFIIANNIVYGRTLFPKKGK